MLSIEDFDKLVIDGQIKTEDIIKIRDTIIENNTAIDSLNNKISDYETRVKDLLDTNAKLYLRVTGQPSSETQVPDVPDVNDILKNWEVK